ncbi:1,4-dihydropyridine esterase [Streptomyces qinzhouensis]|uniref:1,4-dihydropyridine esterase n=1 Tax=Streptomyces qinzhouensis TaxID=2599401 RepID=A0A5B8JA90_9ACTN|nr:1,4-dihydropyridine esterase [Streptomyces qinzhouensis]QDY78256.1 1,4-dihydropyridine esterase [Streptomyces qinzhouensis]
MTGGTKAAEIGKRGGVVLLVSVLVAGAVGAGGAVAAESPPESGYGGSVRSVTIATGERISTGGDGRALRYERPPGRKHIPLMFRTGGGRTEAVPLDVADDIAAGRRDAAGFDITTLTGRPGRPGQAPPGGPAARETTGLGGRTAVTHALTFRFIGRDGTAGRNFVSRLQGLTGAAAGTFHRPDASTGSVTLQVAPGRYALEAVNSPAPADPSSPTDIVVQPRLEVTGPTTVTVDARATRPVRLSVPDRAAANEFTSASYEVAVDGYALGLSLPVAAGGELRTAHLGPEVTDGSLSQSWEAMWTRDTTDYKIVLGEASVRRLATGLRRQFTEGELATVHTGIGSSGTGVHGDVFAWGTAPGSFGSQSPVRRDALPASRTLRLSTAPGTTWALQAEQHRYLPPDDAVRMESSHSTPPRQYTPGSTRTEMFNAGVFSPALDSGGGVFRRGNALHGALPVLADGESHAGWTLVSSARTTLHRDGVLVGENDDPLSGNGSGVFTVPPGDASYTLATSVTRDPAVGRAASRIDASWTFRSRETTATEQLPVSAVRFRTPVDAASTAPAGIPQPVALEVQGPAARPGNLSGLRVEYSYDRGTSWTPATVSDRRFRITNPGRGQSVSFRAAFTDGDGNQGAVTVLDAYYGR